MNKRWIHRHFRFVLGFLLFLLIGHTNQGRQLDAEAPRLQKLTENGKTLLQSRIAAGQLADLRWPNFTKHRSLVQKLYSSLGGTLAWLQDGRPTAQARALVHALETADNEGLRSEDYDGSRWEQRLSQLDQKQTASEPDLVSFDLELTVCALRYVSDLHLGRVDPRQFNFDIDLGRANFDPASFVQQRLIASPNVDAALQSLEPPYPIYQRTKTALQSYLALARRDESVPLPSPPKPAKAIKPGHPYPGTAALAKKLTLLGDLPAGAPVAGEIYEGAIVEGVKHFQERHGLEPNGVLDAQTLRELNTPVSQRITQLELTMERARWVPDTFDRPPIVVNIPEFRVYALDEKFHWVFSMKVVVGKAYRHKTPVFASKIQAVIFRPYWDVPLSIVRAELVPHIQKDPGYVAKNSYQIVDKSGKVVSDGPVDAQIEAGLNTGTLRIRQIPGSKNALGLIKFDIPSTYDVYMHGTPATELFSRSRRDFSHGCIRVEDPVALAKWVLRDTPGWDEEHIRTEMNGDETLRVKLQKPIPVLILYGTAVVAENGEVRFLDDIYKFDASLEKALDQGYAYGTTNQRDQ